MDEIKEIAELASAKVKLDEQELSLGKTLVEQLTSDDLDIGEYADAYTKQVEELIQAKAKGKDLVTAPEVTSAGSTRDLLAALKASVSTKNGIGKKKGR